jgi:energy-coupling factor transporter ATP-binding protein EcfA2
MGENKKNPAELSDYERKELIERIHITFPRFGRVLDKISYCHEHSKIAAEPECLLITGVQGAGKTTLCKAYARRYPRVQTREGRIIPVLSTFVPSITTKKSLPTRLLQALGDGAADRGTSVTQTLRIIKLVRDCGVELIILDEFQHFIDSDSNSVLVNISDWLKDLINETEKPVALVGMPHSEIVLAANPQLERRFAMRESLEPFGWGAPAKEREFKLFLQHLDRNLPLLERGNFADHEVAFRIYCATGGLIGYVMKLVRRAAILAIERREEHVGVELLAESYDERLASRMPRRVNPFRVALEELTAKPSSPAGGGVKRTNRRSKAKGESHSANEVLRRKR